MSNSYEYDNETLINSGDCGGTHDNENDGGYSDRER